MRNTHLIAVLTAALLSACGGGGGSGSSFAWIPTPAPTPAPVPQPEPVAPKPRFGAQISFGDSLSDVGSYAVGTVAALQGGKFTINGDNTVVAPTLTGLNWTEVTAERLGLPAPCAALTGLNGDATKGFSVPVVRHAGCFGYAQGGSRVTNPVGPNNKLTGSELGALTIPVVTQIRNHLTAVGGQFKADDMVLVMAGGNDLLFQLGALSAAATAAGQAAGQPAYVAKLTAELAAGATNPATAAEAIRSAMATAGAQPGSTEQTITQAGIGAAAVQPGNSGVAGSTVHGPMVARAKEAATNAGNQAALDYATAHGPSLVAAMATAGAELVALVKDQVLAKGARYVTVNNLPDVAATPAGLAKSAEVQALMTAMAQAFNAALTHGLSGDARVLLVDVYAFGQATTASPASYGLSNVTDTACDLTVAKNPLSSSLACTGANLVPGDVSHYAYADDVHPTPYYYGLLAKHVMAQMAVRGWL